MKRLLPVSLVVVFAIALGMMLLFTTGGKLKAEITQYEGTGNPEDVNLAALLCDGERMNAALESGEKTRLCVVDAVKQNEDARKLVMKEMLKSPKVRGEIMDKIAATPSLRSEMEAKLAATK